MKQLKGIYYLLILAVCSSGVEMRLRNGEHYTGTLMSEKGPLFILQTDSGQVEVRKESVVAIDGAAYSSILPQSTSSSTVRPLAASSVKKKRPAARKVHQAPVKGEWIVHLKNGSVMRGKPLEQNRRLLVLATKNNPITIFKNVIASIDSTGGTARGEPETDVAAARAPRQLSRTKRAAVPRPSVVAPSVHPAAHSAVSANDGSKVTGITSRKDTLPKQPAAVPEKSTPKQPSVASRFRVATLSGESEPEATPTGEQSPESDHTGETTSVASAEQPAIESISVIRPIRSPGMGVSRGTRKKSPVVHETPKSTATTSVSPVARGKTTVSTVAAVVSAPPPVIPLPAPLAPESAKGKSSAPVRKGTDEPDQQEVPPEEAQKESTAEPSGVETVPPLAAKTGASGTASAAPPAVPKKTSAGVPVAVPVPPMDRASAGKKHVPRKDGKKKVTLLDGTVFIGKVTAEDEHRILLHVDGASLTILKRLIRTVDGAPVETTAASADTGPQSRAPSAKGVPPVASREKTKRSREFFRMLPVVDMPGNLTIEMCTDSLMFTADWKVRSRAARYIGAMGSWGVSAIPVVAKLLTDTVTSEMGVPVWTDSLTANRLLVPGLEAARALAQLGTRGAEHLVNACKSDAPLLRRRGVFGLGNSFHEAAEQTVRKMVQDPDAEVRRIALGSLRPHTAQPVLIRACKDNDPGVRSAAVYLLSKIGSSKAAEHIRTLQDDRNATVRQAVAEALGVIGDAATVSSLSKLSGDTDYLVRAEAVRSLGMLKDSGAVSLLLEAIKDTKSEVRAAAVEALGALRDSRAVPALYALVKDRDRTVRDRARVALKKHTELSLLIAALDDDAPVVRVNASYMLWLLTGKDLGLDREKWETWASAQKKNPMKKKTVIE